jgi:predicted alpha/beta superfamily hydrolase
MRSILAFSAVLLSLVPIPGAPAQPVQPATIVGTPATLSEGERVTLHSAILGEDRIVFVSTPASYDGQRRYPVLYLTDGQFNFDQARATVGFLSRNVMIPQMIVVGIVNRDRTRDLYATRSDFKWGTRTIPFPNSGNADNFLAFIQKELIPWVDATYRTSPLRLFAGHSAGGNFALHAMRTKPLLFQGIIAISPWLSWDDHKELHALESLLASAGTPARALFLSHTGTHDGPDMKSDLDALTAALRARNDPALRWGLSVYPDETHDSTFVKAFYDGLRMIFAGWDYPRDPETNVLFGSLGDLKAHYAKVGEGLGAALPPPPEIVEEMGYRDLGQGKLDEALAAFRFDTEQYPQSANAWDSLGEGLERAGRLEEAAGAYRKAVSLAEAAHDPALEIFQRHGQRLADRIKTSGK